MRFLKLMSHNAELCGATLGASSEQSERCTNDLLSEVSEVIAEKLTFIPKGGMCIACTHKNDIKFCKALNFEDMPKISKGDVDGYVLVKCVEFEREST